MFFSSGSVAPAKAVPLSDAQLEAAALALAPWGELRHGDRLAIGLSPAQILGFVRGALNTLLVGAEAVFYRPQRDPLAEAERLGATSVLLPTALLPLAARHSSRVRLDALRCGGGPVSDAHARAIEETRGVPVRAGLWTDGVVRAGQPPARRPASAARHERRARAGNGDRGRPRGRARVRSGRTG